MSVLLIAHGGAPTAVINASLAGAVRAAKESQAVTGIWGARHGTAGILSESFIDLTGLDEPALRVLSASPASAIGTSRTPLAPEHYARMADILQKHDIGYVLLTGGNGTMDACARLCEACAAVGIQVGGIPKTIDNDLCETDHAPGYGSAARFVAQATREISLDVRAMPIHVCVIEFMGRNAGWLTAASALARDARGDAPDMILLPETPFEEARFLERVRALWALGRGVVIAASEGIRRSDGTPVAPPVFTSGRSTYFGDASGYLAKLVIEKLGVKARAEKPGILGRCCAEMASETDRREAEHMGALAARAVLSGRGGLMAGLRRVSANPYACEETLIPLRDVAMRERAFPKEYISEDGFDVTDAFTDWARPLIGGALPRAAAL